MFCRPVTPSRTPDPNLPGPKEGWVTPPKSTTPTPFSAGESDSELKLTDPHKFEVPKLKSVKKVEAGPPLGKASVAKLNRCVYWLA